MNLEILLGLFFLVLNIIIVLFLYYKIPKWIKETRKRDRKDPTYMNGIISGIVAGVIILVTQQLVQSIMSLPGLVTSSFYEFIVSFIILLMILILLAGLSIIIIVGTIYYFSKL